MLRRRLFRWIALAALAVGTAVAGRGAAQPKRESPAADPCLTAPIRLEQRAGNLNQGLRILSQRSGVRHRAARSYGDRGLVAFRVDTTTEAVQRLLARTYFLTWHREAAPGGYLITETAADRARRTAAWNRAKLAGRKWLRERWEQKRRLVHLSPDELRALGDKGDELARSLEHPRSRALAQLVFGLPGGILQRLWDRGSAVVPVPQLGPEARAQAVAAAGSVRTVIRTRSGQSLEMGPSDLERGTLLLSLGGTPDRPTVWASLRRPGAKGGTHLNLLDRVAQQREPPEARRARLQKAKPPADPRLRKPVTVRDPALGRRADAQRPADAKPLGRLLQDLAGQIDLPVLAECEHRPEDAAWVRDQWWMAAEIVGRPLHQALDLLCADFEYEWEFWEGAILLRPSRWYLPPGERGYRYPPGVRMQRRL